MNKLCIPAAFASGLAAVIGVALSFIGVSALALLMTLLIAAVYLLGARELQQFRAATATLSAALANIPAPLVQLAPWLERIDASLQTAVRLRIVGERVALPGPALTPYLVGLLVMLGMLGTFLGMIVTFKGAMFALDGATDLAAIRSALATPMQGLGLAFGTSVAGVAASGMLGLMSALCRRERVRVARQLDTLIATVFHPFSPAHQREATLQALQQQAQVLPAVVGHLQTLMAQMAQHNQQLNAQLTARQDNFHSEATLAYTRLASAVGKTLTDSFLSSAQMAGATLQPMLESAMTELASESKRQHERMSACVQAQLLAIGTEFSATATRVSQGWQAALHQHERSSSHLVQSLDQTLNAFTHRFEQRAQALQSAAHAAAAQTRSEHLAADQQRLQAWTQQLTCTAAQLHSAWQRIGEKDRTAQDALWQTLQTSASDISSRSTAQAQEVMAAMAQWQAQGEALIRTRAETETRLTRDHSQRMDQLAGLWRTELAALRQEESVRGQAAVARLGELQHAVTSQLATLGAALEAPLSQLMHTASAAPEAAAALITQWRQQMTQLTQRDNLALQEHADLMARISNLLDTADTSAQAQRAAVAALADSTSSVLGNAAQQFSQLLAIQSDKATDVAAHASSSAIELAALGASFHHAVKLFNERNDQMLSNLQHVEAALNQSAQRSEDQLAYYVAQAREVIDLSLSSQRAVLEDLRQLRSQQLTPAEGVL